MLSRGSFAVSVKITLIKSICPVMIRVQILKVRSVTKPPNHPMKMQESSRHSTEQETKARSGGNSPLPDVLQCFLPPKGWGWSVVLQVGPLQAVGSPGEGNWHSRQTGLGHSCSPDQHCPLPAGPRSPILPSGAGGHGDPTTRGCFLQESSPSPHLGVFHWFAY